jgi:hypothetical protein
MANIRTNKWGFTLKLFNLALEHVYHWLLALFEPILPNMGVQ